MRIVFMGTPEFAVASLRALLDAGHEVAAVVTQPDKPAGRGREVRFSPAKRFAQERRIAVEQPDKLRDPAALERLRAYRPELLVVAAYGKILPKALLDLPPRGAINVHASLLPRYRGAAPIQRALLAGDEETGVTIMQLNERMDAGDVLLQRRVAIRPDDTAATLQARLAAIGAATLVDALAALERGELRPTPQREADATLAPVVKKEEGRIDWRRPASAIERAVRAFTPWPGAHTTLRGKLLKIHRAAVVPESDASPPGTVVQAAHGGIEVATGEGRLRLLELQLEGKRRLGAAEFLAGGALRKGERLGDVD